jgi:hypothetical protein
VPGWEHVNELNKGVVSDAAVAAALASTLAVSAGADDDDRDHKRGPFNFKPLAELADSAEWDPTAP